MGRTSSLRRLPPEVLAEINRLISEGRFTLDEILQHLRNLGVDSVSRSALGRQKQKIDRVAAKLRQSREITSALVRELGEDTTAGEQGRLLVETLRGMVYDWLQERIEQGEPADPKSLTALARTLKDMAQATRMSQDYELKLREAARKEAEKKLEEASRKAAAESAGLTPEAALERMKAIYRGEA